MAGFTQIADAQSTSAGSEIWSSQTGIISTSPTVVNGTVFIGSQDGGVYALDATDGNKEWRFEAGGRVSSPTVINETLFVGTSNNNIYALDATDGSKEWRFETGGAVSSPTVVDGTLFAGTSNNNIYALDATDGNKKWRFETDDSVVSSPTIVGGTLFIGSFDGNVYALDTTDGQETWRFQTGSPIGSSPTITEETVFIGTVDSDLYALTVADGSKTWSSRNAGGSISSPTVAGDTIFVGDTDSVCALDLADGNKKWQFGGIAEAESSPTVVEGTVFIGGGVDNSVYALDANDGSVNWTFQTDSLVYSSPTVVAGTVFIGSVDGNMYALDAGVSGSSIGSRVNLGTLGHHHVFAENGPNGPGTPDEPELETGVTGITTDSAGNSLGDIEIRAQNRETDDVITATTDANGEYELALDPNTEYRVLVFDQFGLEQTEFEELIEVAEEESRNLDIELLSKFEVFREQKLGSDRVTGLAPRIDNLSTPLIAEQKTVETEINNIETAVNTGDIDQELAEEAIERMVFGEAMVTRSLEALIDTTPTNLAGYDWSQGPLIFEDEMPNYDLLFQTSKALVVGLVEASYSLKKIAKEALGEFADQIRSRILTAIGNLIRDLLSDFQRVLDLAESAWSIREMLVEIKAAADEAIVRINEGATYDNKRAVILDLADPIADQIATSLLAGAELLSIDDQLTDLNTTLSADSLTNDPTFANDITTIADDARTELRDVETKVQQAKDAMEPESDALEGLIDLVSELADAGFTDIPALLRSIWDIVRDLVSVISSGFNIGFGIVRARDVYTDSAAVVSDITDTV